MKTKSYSNRSLFALVISIGALLPGFIHSAYAAPEPSWPAANPAAIARWQAMRFGMFIHWGPVSLTGQEISWSRGIQVPIPVYDNLYKRFDPEKFNADEWVSIAKAAGMKYIVLTAKHCDGFCLWDTKFTDYNIMRTPFHRDVVKELSEACKKQGIAFGAYYSVPDWYNPGWPVTSPAGSVRREKSDMDAYEKYLQNQITELIKNYGPLITIWNDMPAPFGKRGADTIKLVRSLQPDILINDRTGDGGDYGTPEQQIGGFNLDSPWESCMTVSGHDHWAWGGANDGVKSVSQCVRMLVACAGGDGNMLLNVGPRPDGIIDPAQANLLKEVGAWMDKNGESIYGTRGGPWKPTQAIASTRKGNTIFIHILNSSDGRLKLPELPVKITSVSLLNGGKVEFSQTALRLALTVPEDSLDAIDTIVRLELEGSAMGLPAMSADEFDCSFADDPVTYGAIVSRGAKVKVSSLSEWMPPDGGASLVAKEQPAPFAFHTGQEAAPAVDIDLGKVMKVTGVFIRNSQASPERMATLCACVSLDGQTWSEIWRAGQMKKQWEFPVTADVAGAEVPGRDVRFIRLQTHPEQPSWLQLKQVEIYGKE